MAIAGSPESLAGGCLNRVPGVVWLAVRSSRQAEFYRFGLTQSQQSQQSQQRNDRSSLLTLLTLREDFLASRNGRRVPLPKAPLPPQLPTTARPPARRVAPAGSTGCTSSLKRMWSWFTTT